MLCVLISYMNETLKFKRDISFLPEICRENVAEEISPDIRFVGEVWGLSYGLATNTLPARLQWLHNICSDVTFNFSLFCANFIHEWWDLQFKVDFFEKLLHDNFIYSQSFCQKSAERKSPKKYFFKFRFVVWPKVWTVVVRLISQHTT